MLFTASSTLSPTTSAAIAPVAQVMCPPDPEARLVQLEEENRHLKEVLSDLYCFPANHERFCGKSWDFRRLECTCRLGRAIGKTR